MKNEFNELMSIGIDIGKDTFRIVVFDPSGQRVLRKQIKCLALIAKFEKLPRGIVGMEACLADDWWAMRRIELTVNADNAPAIGLYKRMGFEREGVLRDYALRGGELINAVSMARLANGPRSAKSIDT